MTLLQLAALAVILIVGWLVAGWVGVVVALLAVILLKLAL